MSTIQANYRNNPNLKPVNVKLEYTKEQIEEYVKCSEDPIYFITNYVKITNVDEGVIPFKLYEYQKYIINELNNNRHNLLMAPRQSGKCLTNNAEIKIRNKKTGIIETISIDQFYKLFSLQGKVESPKPQ